MTREEALQAIKEKIAYYERDKRLRGAIETLIPELCENEDEKTRKEIIDFIQWAEDRGMTRHDYHQAKRPAVWIAYLENQKEQIPYTDFVIKPHKGDENNPYDMSASEAQEYTIKRGFGVPFIDGEVYVDERHMTQTIGNIIRWADEHPKEQNPAGWSEEDEKMRNALWNLLKIQYAQDCSMTGVGIEAGKFRDWLKSLRPQPKAELTLLDKNIIEKEDIQKVLELALEYYKLEVFGTGKESGKPNQERIDWIYDRMKEENK